MSSGNPEGENCIKIAMTRNAIPFLAVVAAASSVFSAPPMASFKTQQMQFERVRTAAREKQDVLKKVFAEKKLAYPPAAIFIRVFKTEKTLEVWAAPALGDRFALALQYRLCA